MPRKTTKIPLPAGGIGNRYELVYHQYGLQSSSSSASASSSAGSAPGAGRCYIQGSLHADELPGLLVVHHLIKMLDEAEANGRVLKEILLVPYANPIGLSQILMGSHIGRFNFDTGVNFNRDWMDIIPQVKVAIKDKLSPDDVNHNVKTVRDAIYAEASAKPELKLEKVMKKELYKLSCVADIVLDLHCDTEAILHTYTHTRTWPHMNDLAFELGSNCTMLAEDSGGNCFDESNSCPWSAVADAFPSFPIPMQCQSVTVELRGERDVTDELAVKDAAALFRFLQRRGYIAGGESLIPITTEMASYPLTGVEMIEAIVPGVACWKKHIGDIVNAGDILGEIVNIEDPDAPRTPVITKQSGVIFGVRPHALVRPGQIIIKVAGKDALDWRKGLLLTAK